MKKRNILTGIIALLIVAQFFRIDKSQPSTDPTKDFVTLEKPPEAIASMFKNACYDCHSHHSKYPWYTNVSPISWWIKGHIDEGREHLNFSTWADYSPEKRKHKLEEIQELVTKKFMPLTPYLLLHSEAKLSDADRKNLTDWVKGKI